MSSDSALMRVGRRQKLPVGSRTRQWDMLRVSRQPSGSMRQLPHCAAAQQWR
jgi:hypothetical protein